MMLPQSGYVYKFINFHLTKQHKIGYYILYYWSVQGAMTSFSLWFQTFHKVCNTPHHQ
jgi:hypothetical protein